MEIVQGDVQELEKDKTTVKGKPYWRIKVDGQWMTAFETTPFKDLHVGSVGKFLCRRKGEYLNADGWEPLKIPEVDMSGDVGGSGEKPSFKEASSYESDTRLQILKGQCLNLANNFLSQDPQTMEDDWGVVAKKTFDLAKVFFEQSKKEDFLGWK